MGKMESDIQRQKNRKIHRNSSGRRRQTGQRLLTGLLALAMVLTQQSAFAGILSVQAKQSGGGRLITDFAPLTEDTAHQEVSFGTQIGELDLPDTLKASVLLMDEEMQGGGGKTIRGFRG